MATVDVSATPRLESLEYVAPLAPSLSPDLAVTAIDMPIGLSDTGSRACDVAARKLLQPHGTRVFPAPPRVALAHVDDYDAACSASIAATGKSLSKQTWNLLRSIAEVDALALTDASRKSYELSDALYRGGSQSYLEALDAQRSLYSAQQDLITLRLTEQSNRITLYKVLGGGWN